MVQAYVAAVAGKAMAATPQQAGRQKGFTEVMQMKPEQAARQRARQVVG